MQNIVEEQRALVRQRTLTQQRKLQKIHLHILLFILPTANQRPALGYFFSTLLSTCPKLYLLSIFLPHLHLSVHFLHIYRHNHPSKSLCKLKSGNHTQSPFLTLLIQPISRDFKFHYTALSQIWHLPSNLVLELHVNNYCRS